MALADFPRYPLTFGPSPVHRLERLTAHLGGATIWAKREDCNSGLAYGGNKTRKLEYLVPDALAQGADTLVSIGGFQSNHTRQVAAVAAQLGMRCVLVQEKWVDWPDASTTGSATSCSAGSWAPTCGSTTPASTSASVTRWRQAIDDVEAAGGTPYAIPAGASDHPLGGLGSRTGREEVEQQERELGVFFDTIVVCTVTGSTHAGMIAGFAGQDRPRRVIGIDASATLDKTRDQVARIARNTAELIGLGRDLRDDEITVLEGWAGDLYGIPVQSTLDAIRLTGQLEGMIIDPVYEGKSMAGLIDLVRRRRDRSATRTCSTPTSAASPRSTPTPACSPTPSASTSDRASKRSFGFAFFPASHRWSGSSVKCRFSVGSSAEVEVGVVGAVVGFACGGLCPWGRVPAGVTSGDWARRVAGWALLGGGGPPSPRRALTSPEVTPAVPAAPRTGGG